MQQTGVALERTLRPALAAGLYDLLYAPASSVPAARHIALKQLIIGQQKRAVSLAYGPFLVFLDYGVIVSIPPSARRFSSVTLILRSQVLPESWVSW